MIASCAWARNLCDGLAEGGVLRVGARDHLAQRVEHRRQIGLELLHRLAEFRDLGALVAEEQAEQLFQRGDVVHAAAHHLLPVLDQDRLGRVLEDDVVLRVAAAELVLDLGVEVVLLVLRLPVAEGHAQLVEQRAVDVAPVLGLGLDLVFGDEDEVVRAGPALQQILERLAHHRFAVRAGDLAQVLQLVEVLLDEDLAHAPSRARSA